MTISSRTPEGTPGECPVCGTIICIDPSRPTGDAPCPSCGVLLWFVTLGGGARFFSQSEISSRKRELIEALTTSSPDSLDVIETVMFLEEVLGMTVDEDKLREMHSVDEIIDYIIRELPD